MVLLSIHKICLGWEITKRFFFYYTLKKWNNITNLWVKKHLTFIPSLFPPPLHLNTRWKEKYIPKFYWNFFFAEHFGSNLPSLRKECNKNKSMGKDMASNTLEWPFSFFILPALQKHKFCKILFFLGLKLSDVFILQINVKMQTIVVVILTFMSMIKISCSVELSIKSFIPSRLGLLFMLS